MPRSLRLEAFAEADFDRLISWIPTADFLMQWAGPAFRFPLDHGQLDHYVASSRREPPGCFPFRVVADDAVIGHVELGAIDRQNRSARLGRVLVGPEGLRGQGFGQQIVREAMAVAFGQLQLHRIELLVFDFNHAAIACYERVGFRHEGTLREARRCGETYWNLCIMSLLEHEWSGQIWHS